MQQIPVFQPVPQRLRPVSGSALKLIAVVTMLIDHIGAGILYPYLMLRDAFFSLTRTQSIQLYRWFRHIGRIAFPVYCFLLVEGFFHTGNRLRYLLRLLVFALLSEIPFDLALIPGNNQSHTLHVLRALQTNRAVYLYDQNVFFTLLIGLAVIWAIDAVFSLAARRGEGREALRTPFNLLAALLAFAAVLAGYYAADALYTDYSHNGVVLIVVLYLLYRIRPLSLLAGYVYFVLVMPNEIWCLPAFLLILFYSGKRGFIRGGMKYFFYAFYPAHLFLIYVVRTFIL